MKKEKKHGKKYDEVQKLIEKDKEYSKEEAVALAKKTSTTKFDGSIELHVRLGLNTKKTDQQVRGTVSLPHGTGKTIKIAAFTDKIEEAKTAGAEIAGGKELIDEIKKTGKCDFDVAIAEPNMMKNMAPIARVLGPRGLMPSAKNETITSDVSQTIEALKKGKVAFKNDDTSNLHMLIGKVSFSDEQLIENFNSAIEAIKKAKPAASKGSYIKNISVASSMGPGVRIKN